MTWQNPQGGNWASGSLSYGKGYVSMLPAVGHCLVGAFFLAKVLMSWGRVACLLPQGCHNHSE